MPKSSNVVRDRWAAGEVAFGSLLGIASPTTAYIVGQAGFDWVSIEQQHAFASQSDLLPLLHALELGGTTPIVRVGENDPIGMQRALDLGARGIVVPMVNTVQHAEVVRDNTRFPPLGFRSWGSPRLHATPEEANDDIVVMVMIETPEAVDNVAAILEVEGIDGVVVGPADLAMFMGAGPAAGPGDPGVWKAFEQVGEACKRAGKHYGSFVTSEAIAEKMVQHGADFLLFSSDIGDVAIGAAAAVETIGRFRAASE